ncbi:MAG: transglycosylase SLT domain-containing protein [bacterium]|nr:transglycosylase SLT domain-containing protein [bacterium]
MKKCFVICVTILVSFVFSSFLNGQSGDPFVTPDNLKDNVAFWKKIYTEVSLYDGLIHDREYPLIIYKKITTGKKSGRRRRQHIRKYINQIANSLNILNRKKPSQWGPEEKRIAELFKRHASMKAIKTARSRVRFQQGQKERYRGGLERSGAYMTHILRVFNQYGVPSRIAFLPHVESSFVIKAYSKVGAAGMWQFMRRTGRLYMKVNYKVDERWDPYKSTVAAAKLLKQNYKKLKSWPLAITAYNHGLASISRAVRVTKSRDLGVIIDKYKNRRFRFASKNFYGCFLAASEIASNPHKYFPNLKFHKPKEYKEMVLKSYIRPSVLSKHLGIPSKELARLNPAIRPTVFRRNLTIPRGYKLRLPGTLTPAQAAQKMTAIPGSLKRSKSEDYDYYSVRRGDTLYRIARRHGISLRMLQDSNDIGRRNRIYIGQVLRIPVPGKTMAKKRPAKKTGKKKAARPGKARDTKPVTTKNSIAAKPAPDVSSKSTPEASTKAAPDTAEKTTSDNTGIGAGTTSQPPVMNQKDIARAKQAMKKLGELVARIADTPAETKTGPDSGNFDATVYNFEVSGFSKKKTAKIRVEVDETLGNIADWLNVPIYRIRRLNRHGRRSIKIGQRLVLPLDRGSVKLFTSKRLEFHMALEEDFYNRYEVTGVKERRVKRGENIWSICNDDDEIPMWLFKKYNRNLDISKLTLNTTVKLPVIKEK